MAKKCDRDFILQTVQMIQEEGKAVAQVARELGISENTLYDGHLPERQKDRLSNHLDRQVG
ncbi:transposase [Paenibacillus xylaniclasticus]|uniref:transposase n=1 Tax=Paenibacillus xylaniclasticus TaxID=588083 RepID=UPI000FD87C52|nr:MULTISPECIES: transposase [Paenibacillus]GFN32154.1 hypothetical protein PCURB6_24140 [Paenibacillus curdlanolyticus]